MEYSDLAKNFFDDVETALRNYKGNDPVGVDFFISDIEELIIKWEEDSKEVKRSFWTIYQ